MFKKIKHSSKGAVDLPSTMVGVTVIGLVSGVVAATVFVAIPWAQDNSAKQQLSSIAIAQAAYAGVTAPKAGFNLTAATQTAIVDNSAKYASLKELSEKKLLKLELQEGSETVSADGKVCVSYDAVSGEYNSAVISATGSIFASSSNQTEPVKVTDGRTCIGKVKDGLVLPPAPEMVSLWNTALPGCTTITLPLSGVTAIDVDWGDGRKDLDANNSPSHTYSGPAGVKTVKVSGTFTKWGDPAAKPCITQVTKWEETGTTDLSYGFANAANLTEVKQIPKSSTNLSYMFNQSTYFNGDISAWDVSNVTDMSYMFNYARSFDGKIGSWKTNKVTNMSNMFAWGNSFNSDISTWNVGNVTNMSNMFYMSTEFNKPINWSTSSKVTNMNNMFAYAGKFNSSLVLNTINVTDMGYMFKQSSEFNQPLNFNTAKVTNFENMFDNARKFNQPLNTWNVSSATNMTYMFYESTLFNGNVTNWNTANVTNMRYTFGSARAFNQNISGWNTAKVTTMYGMFSSTDVFNQNISSWNTGNVTTMGGMFWSNVYFNQNISGWNVAKVTEWTQFTSKALTVANTPVKFR